MEETYTRSNNWDLATVPSKETEWF